MLRGCSRTGLRVTPVVGSRKAGRAEVIAGLLTGLLLKCCLFGERLFCLQNLCKAGNRNISLIIFFFCLPGELRPYQRTKPNPKPGKRQVSTKAVIFTF